MMRTSVSPTTSKVECQICSGFFAVDKKGLVFRHGFERPGHGHITGSRCLGVGRRPFPAFDAIEALLDTLRGSVVMAKEQIKRCATFEVRSFTVLRTPWRAQPYFEHFAVGVTDPHVWRSEYWTRERDFKSDLDRLLFFVHTFEARLEKAKAMHAPPP